MTEQDRPKETPVQFPKVNSETSEVVSVPIEEIKERRVRRMISRTVGWKDMSGIRGEGYYKSYIAPEFAVYFGLEPRWRAPSLYLEISPYGKSVELSVGEGNFSFYSINEIRVNKNDKRVEFVSTHKTISLSKGSCEFSLEGFGQIKIVGVEKGDKC